MVVAFEIRRPWPTRSSMPYRKGPRWEWTIYRKHGRDHQGWNPRRWWRPGSWSPFVVAFGRRFFFPPLVTIWHVEPHGHDSGEVCKHRRQRRDGTWKYTTRWRWHVWHWHVQFGPVQRLKRFLLERCELCGRRYPWGYAPVSHQWDAPGSRWFGGLRQRRAYHHECSALGHVRQQVEGDERIIRQLVAALCLAWDKSEAEVIDQLTGHADDFAPFHDRYRLTGMFGYERDGAYKLVKKAARG